MAKYWLGKKLSEEHKEKIRMGNLGVKRSEESRKRMSLAQMGNKKAIGNKNALGRKHTEEFKRRVSLKLKGRKGHSVLWTEQRKLEWSKRKKGEGNNNWKGGITPIHKRERLTWKYRLWSLSVRKRDGKCLECGQIENLHAHHLISFTQNKEKQYDLDNGITLCAKCHYQKHKIRRTHAN